MKNPYQAFLLFLTTAVAGLLAGFFYTWSFTIMQSLDLIGEREAATAMISINENIRSGWFAAIFFGTPILTLVSLIAFYTAKNKTVYVLVALALVFAIATLVITFTQHLPLNAELANGLGWSSYIESWVQWNHVRMVTSLLAFLILLYTCNADA